VVPAWLRLILILTLALGSVHSRAVAHEHPGERDHHALEQAAVQDHTDYSAAAPDTNDSGKSLAIASDHHTPLAIAVEPQFHEEAAPTGSSFRLAENGPAPPTWRSPPLTEPPSA
jgi:hypothetical protein